MFTKLLSIGFLRCLGIVRIVLSPPINTLLALTVEYDMPSLSSQHLLVTPTLLLVVCVQHSAWGLAWGKRSADVSFSYCCLSSSPS